MIHSVIQPSTNAFIYPPTHLLVSQAVLLGINYYEAYYREDKNHSVVTIDIIRRHIQRDSIFMAANDAHSMISVLSRLDIYLK